MLQRLLFLTVCACCCSMAANGFAQQDDVRPPNRSAAGVAARLFQFDTDGDGQLSPAEIPDRFAPFLRRADQNADDQITREELIAHIKNQTRNPAPDSSKQSNSADGRDTPTANMIDAPRGAGPENRNVRGRTVPPPGLLMQVLDADGDGRLSADEVNNATAAIKSLDRDGNGAISFNELRPRHQPSAPPAGRAAADAVDSAADRSGVAGAANGKSSADGRMATFLLRRFDSNADGRLSNEELPEAVRARLADMDTNSDGWIDRAEIDARERRMAGQRQKMSKERRSENGPAGSNALQPFTPGGDVPRRPPADTEQK